MTVTGHRQQVLDDHGRALLFTEARTANSFEPTPVTDDQLRDIWELAKWPPTSANTQPLRVVYIRTESSRNRLLPYLHDGNRAKTASAPVTGILAVDTRFHERIPELVPFRPDLREVFEADPERREMTAGLNAGLQVGYFILAVRAAGLAAGPMTGFDPAGVDREFFPDGRFRSLVVVNIGYPAEGAWMDRLPRLDPRETLDWQ